MVNDEGLLGAPCFAFRVRGHARVLGASTVFCLDHGWCDAVVDRVDRDVPSRGLPVKTLRDEPPLVQLAVRLIAGPLAIPALRPAISKPR